MSWPFVALGDLFEHIRNGMNVRQNAESGGLPISRIETIASGTVNYSKVGYAGLGAVDSKWLLKPGDILFSHINSVPHVGKCALVTSDRELVHGMNLLAMRPAADRLLSEFGVHLLRSPWFRAELLRFVNRAVNQASVSITNLKSIEIPLPPLDEQKRIAAILDKADALRQARRRAITRLDDLAQSIFYEMFGDFDGDLLPLEVLGRVSTGATPSTKRSEYFDGDVPFVTPGDLESSQPVKRYLTAAGAAKSRTVEPGAAMVCCIGATIGKMGIADAPSAFNQQINAVQWGDRVTPEFGLQALRAIKPLIVHRGKGASTTLPILKKSEFSKLLIPVPSMISQTQFSEKVRSATRYAALLTKSSENTERLFASLQQRAFREEL